MKPNRRVIGFWIISGVMGATGPIVAIRFWWPAWIVLAAWFVFLAVNGFLSKRGGIVARIARPIPQVVRDRAHGAVTKQDDGCWISTYGLRANGYATLSHMIDGKVHAYLAHRASWEFVNGPANPDMVIDHICYERRCVNPDHLRQISHSWNSRRQNGVDTPEDTCRWGHPHSSRRLVRRGRWMVNVCWDCMDEHNQATSTQRAALRQLEIAYGLGDHHTRPRGYFTTLDERNERRAAIRALSIHSRNEGADHD